MYDDGKSSLVMNTISASCRPCILIARRTGRTAAEIRLKVNLSNASRIIDVLQEMEKAGGCVCFRS